MAFLIILECPILFRWGMGFDLEVKWLLADMGVWMVIVVILEYCFWR